jgi:hypothetical protein
MSKERTFTIPDFIEALDSLANEAYQHAIKLKEKGYIDGLGFYYFGRCVSCLLGAKTLLFMIDLSVTNKEFAQQYKEKGLASKFLIKDDQIAMQYIKETNMAVRFTLFQNFYSQTEFTYRIIQREKYPEETNANPFRLMTDRYAIMNVDFVKFINAIRNTIHNNGYYFPKGDTSDFVFDFQGKTFHFVNGKPVTSVTIWDIIDIITYVLGENEKLFAIEELAKIKFSE